MVHVKASVKVKMQPCSLVPSNYSTVFIFKQQKIHLNRNSLRVTLNMSVFLEEPGKDKEAG